MKRISTALLLWLFATHALAQTAVEVSVVDDTGAALSGLSVYAFNNNTYSNKSGVTNAAGVATLTLNDGDFRFRVDKSGTQYFSAASNHCTVPACTTASVTLPRPTEVIVTSSAGGVEAGLPVYAFNGSNYINKSAVTNAAGVASFQLPIGSYRFRIDKNGTQFFTGASNHCEAPGCTAVSYEVPESVTVNVVGDHGAEAGLNVYAFNGNNYINKSAVTDSSGNAVFTLAPGSYRFRIDKSGTHYFTDNANHCTTPGCNAVNFAMPAPVAVTVTSSAGGAEAGLTVYAFNGNNYVNKSAVTNGDGVANFQLPLGNYRFRIDKNGTQFFTDVANHCAVPGCSAVSYEVPESVTVSVTSSGGGVEAGLNVYAFKGNTYVNKSAVTNASGQASFTLLPGNYRFRIDKNGTQFFTDTVNHCTAPGCNAVSYVVPESVTVAVSSTAGAPEAGLTVYAFDGATYVNKSAVTNASGHATFTLLPGNYRFRIDKAGAQHFTSATNHCAVPGCTLIAHQIPASLSAFVLDSALGACIDAAGTANGWTLPSQVTSLSCNSLGISNLFGLETFSNLSNLSLANNPITLLNALQGLNNLTSLNLSGTTQLECSALGNLESQLGTGVITHPASCLGEGELVFSINNPGQPATNQFSFAVASTPAGDLISSAITYNPLTESYDGRVYLIDGTSGAELMEIQNPSPSGYDHFGWSVASTSSGDIVVGAWNDQVGGSNAGAVYVFDGADGSLLHTIMNPQPSASDRFGYALATGDDGSVVVGAPQPEGGGAVYLFDSEGDLQQTLSVAGGDTNAEFGRAVAVNDSGEIIVGAPKQDVSAETDSGAVYVFAAAGSTPLLTIINPDAAAFDDYGSAVAVSGNGDIIVSARFKDNFAADDGSVFVHDGFDGDLLWSVANPTADAQGLFASSLAATPDGNVVVGAANDDSGTINSGRVFVYNGSDGALIKIIDNPEPEENVNFGQGLAVTPNGQIAVGAFGADGGFGKLYLFASVGEGETLTPVNQLPIADAALQACVLDQAAQSGWATVSEVTALDCANSDITDLAGLEALTDLETLDLSGNTDILCTALDALELALPNTTITRPTTCSNGGTTPSQQVQNLHNAQGQRVVKTVNGDANTAIHFLYDQSGQVIAEIDASTGTTLREYIYVNGQQIAIVDDTGTQNEEAYFVHNDHLGTPQKITDQTQAIVWDATYEPFGEVEVATEEIENNIRFPGQYADEETGLNYNYFRDYDPSTGRYVESDPIGLSGGLNTYGYVSMNPASNTDYFGLNQMNRSKHAPGENGRKGPFGPACGASGSDTRFWIPDGIWRNACIEHDRCYGTCGKSKQQCDLQLWRQSGNTMYFIAVYGGGHAAYRQAQKEAKCNDC
jgi:RHS repeat-associated protein